ncbi:ABC transporter ATP-binding protein [Paenibacillus sp. LHD-117]|uniref:ABC transporter ATP-binding protein n=1 Tax=Paenibacillus sp. LHD-117 TaxID=3071412 RepID=UPI0027E071A1|nr:ABC transporter ATP-binding protein [Paenibacillus sp. LHD-117]MDQ6421284.1 ABC transporter ATP-binding protein [Paenibacillus sp. LHD-117]
MELILQGVTKSFGDKKVLQGAEFQFQKGKIYGLLGRNGAGKTTLFNCLSGETRIDDGHARLKEAGVARELVEEDIGYVYSLPILPEFLTGYEFIKFFLDINRDKHPHSNIDDYFDKISMSQEDRHRLIKNYSHGMKNKIQMLLFLISKPPVILLDEPLTLRSDRGARDEKYAARNEARSHTHFLHPYFAIGHRFVR